MKLTKESTKHRAAGPEKPQDRPTHATLQTLTENDKVTNMEEQQQSSSSSSHDIDTHNFDSENQQLQLPVVDALATPNPGLRGTLAHIATAKQLQDTIRTNRELNIRQHIFKNLIFNSASKRPIKRTCYVTGLSLACHPIHLLLHLQYSFLHTSLKLCRMSMPFNSYSNLSP
jgi:hypothetical protein